MKRALWLFEATLFFLLSFPIAILPYQYSMKAGAFLGLFLFYAWGSRRRIAIENMGKAVEAGAVVISEPLEKVIREHFRNLGGYFVEILKIYYGLGRHIIDSVEFEGLEHIHQAQSKGRGIIFLTGHCGNWELMAIAASVKLTKLKIVARSVNNPYLNGFIEKAREKYGNTVIYKRGALKGVMESLNKGECVGILMDQAVTRPEGYVTEFLGRAAWTTKIPSLIARKTGAAVLPAFIHRTGKGHRVMVYPEVALSNSTGEEAVVEDTRRFSEYIERYIERYIREYPSEWLWIHRRWKRVK